MRQVRRDFVKERTVAESSSEMYLSLLKNCLTRSIFGEGYEIVEPRYGSAKRFIFEPTRRLLAAADLMLVRRVPFDAQRRAEGMDWPAEAETMIGSHRLDHLQDCVLDVLQRDVPGDLIETGAWRGGATIFMRAALEAYGDVERTVWVADSFAGLPRPDESTPDQGDIHWTRPQLQVSLDQVKNNFARYGLLDERVKFLVGWFKDTLPRAPIDRLSILRMDGDMYSSTMDALDNLYSKLSVGGYVIVDDYSLPGCRAAVEEFRARHNIAEPMQPVGSVAVSWLRES
jgi:O-methyltransferase